MSVQLSAFGLLALLALAGGLFSGVRSKVERVGPRLLPKEPSCELEILDKDKPERSHQVVARIEVFVRRNKLTQGRRAVYEEALPELRKQACKVGADAVFVLRQTVSHSGEFKLLYVKTEALHYTKPPAAPADP